MVVSNPALVILDDTRGGFFRRIKQLLRFGRSAPDSRQYALNPLLDVTEPVSEATVELVAVMEVLPPPVVAAVPEPLYRPPFDVQAREIVLTPDERRARAIALRGLSQSRAHKFDAAHASFVQATQMDPLLDLAKMPDFWRLPTGAHQAAIAAYEFVGRNRDAAALTAAARDRFRPRLVASSPGPQIRTAMAAES